MSKPKKIEISGLNIKTQPHSPERYVELFIDVFNLQQAVSMRSDYYGMIGSRSYVDSKIPVDGITGNLNRYLEIDPSKPWYNKKENKEAEFEDVAEVHIPEHLKPNMSYFRYVFYPVGHRLFFETYSDGSQVGPTTVLSFFKKLFNHESITKKYGSVEIFLEPTKESLEDIFAIHELRRLEISITRPNPDDPFESFEHVFYERMSAENADVYENTLKGTDLTPSNETEMTARIAASNGIVKGFGRDAEGNSVNESTRDHPLREKIFYDSDFESPKVVFLQKTVMMLSGIRTWLSGG